MVLKVPLSDTQNGLAPRWRPCPTDSRNPVGVGGQPWYIGRKIDLLKVLGAAARSAGAETKSDNSSAVAERRGFSRRIVIMGDGGYKVHFFRPCGFHRQARVRKQRPPTDPKTKRGKVNPPCHPKCSSPLSWGRSALKTASEQAPNSTADSSRSCCRNRRADRARSWEWARRRAPPTEALVEASAVPAGDSIEHEKRDRPRLRARRASAAPISLAPTTLAAPARRTSILARSARCAAGCQADREQLHGAADAGRHPRPQGRMRPPRAASSATRCQKRRAWSRSSGCIKLTDAPPSTQSMQQVSELVGLGWRDRGQAADCHGT